MTAGFVTFQSSTAFTQRRYKGYRFVPMSLLLLNIERSLMHLSPVVARSLAKIVAGLLESAEWMG
jgi:hypothetical protein